MRRLDHVARAIHVGAVHGRIVGQPEMIAGCHMKAPFAPAQAARQRRAIIQIAVHALHGQPLDAARIAAAPQQRAHLVAGLDQNMRKVGPHKSRGARDETPHGTTSPSMSRFATRMRAA